MTESQTPALSRRALLSGAAALIGAPAIVRLSSLVAVKAPRGCTASEVLALQAKASTALQRVVDEFTRAQALTIDLTGLTDRYLFFVKPDKMPWDITAEQVSLTARPSERI